MKSNLQAIAIILILGIPLLAGVKTGIMFCDYTGGDTDIIYTVYTQVNYATVFELPPGKEIKNVVLGDPISWRAKVDDEGKVCFVKPTEVGIRTSLSIVTADNQIFVFSLVENTAEPNREIIAKVKIIVHDDDFFVQRTRDKLSNGKTQEKKEEEVLQFIRKKSKKYSIKNNQFFIENVCDDGVFTYLYVPRAQYRPAIYFKEKKKADPEPIRYIDKGDYYVVHKVLTNKDNLFLLKLGETETTIRISGD